MAKGSNAPALKEAFLNHLKETHGQVSRLEKAAALLAMKPTGKKCMGMEGVIKEGAEALEEDGDDSVLDLGIVGAGSRVEHYEMAGYITAISLAARVGVPEVASLLKQSLVEEENAEKTLSCPWQKHLFRENGDWLEFPPSAPPSKRDLGRGGNSCLYPIFPANKVSPRAVRKIGVALIAAAPI